MTKLYKLLVVETDARRHRSRTGVGVLGGGGECLEGKLKLHKQNKSQTRPGVLLNRVLFV